MYSAAAAHPVVSDSLVNRVQIDSLVIMKIVKHIESERASGAGTFAHGFLTGLVSDTGVLEVTHCFPTARAAAQGADDPAAEESAEERDRENTREMLVRYRKMNIDYELVGFYESHPFGACFNKQLVEDLHLYQSTIKDNIVLVYDPVKTLQGQLSCRAFRLSPAAMDLCYVDLSPDTVKSRGLTYENMFEELPVTIKNSHLINVLLAELQLVQLPTEKEPPLLEIGEDRSVARCLRQMSMQIDVLNRAVGDYNKYQQQKQKQEALLATMKQKRELENEQRRKNGEPELPLEELSRQIKWPTLSDRDGMLAPFLAAREVHSHAQHALEAASRSVGRLYVAESVTTAGK